MTSTVIYIPLLPRYQTKNTKLRTNTGHQSTQQHQQQLANLAHKSLPPIPPSARSPITATTARIRDYTASLLLNKRVRSVVDEANGLMHLRPTRVIKARITSKKFANLAHKTAFNRLPLAHQSHQLQQDTAISLPHFC